MKSRRIVSFDDDATSRNCTTYEKQQAQKRTRVQLGTKVVADNGTENAAVSAQRTPKPTSATLYSPAVIRRKSAGGRQRRLTDSMILEEASDTFLKAFSEQVSRLRHLTDGLQYFDASTVYSPETNPVIMKDLEGRRGQVDTTGRRSNWRAVSLASGYRFRSSSASAVGNQARTHQTVPNDSRANGEPEWQQPSPRQPPKYMRKYLGSAAPIATLDGCESGPEISPAQKHRQNREPVRWERSLDQSIGRMPPEHLVNLKRNRDRAEVSYMAPLAKLEQLADLEKPDMDSKLYEKQTSRTTPQQAPRLDTGSSGGNQGQQKWQSVPVHCHNKTIRFVDEDTNNQDGFGEDRKLETAVTNDSRDQIIQQEGRNGSNGGVWGNRMENGRADTVGWHIRLPLENSSIAVNQHGYKVDNCLRFRQSHLIEEELVPGNFGKSGIVFLQYQGETKRLVLPYGQDGTTRSAVRTMDDVRHLFLKAFQMEIAPEYMQSPQVKVYIQDPTKTDVFYELEDLNDVKDRAVLKLHECPVRANSPISSIEYSSNQVQQQHQQHQQATRSLAALDQSNPNDSNLSVSQSNPRQQLRNELHNVALYYNNPIRPHRHPTEDVNYFSEPEFDVNGDYQVGLRRHYGTMDRYCGPRSSGLTNFGRSSYRGCQQVPPKPERHLGPGIPSGGRSSMRRSHSPPRFRYLNSGRAAIGHSSDTEDAYGVRGNAGNGEYGTNPNSDALMDVLYNRPPSVPRSGSATPIFDEEARIRMINMEKQLASLSSLVHSALVSNGTNDNVYKDLEMLRREIFGTASGMQQSNNGGLGNAVRDDSSDSGSISRGSDVGSDQANAERDIFYSTFSANGPSELTKSMNGSVGQTGTAASSQTRHTLRNCKRRVGELQTELKNLRRLAQLNAQSSRDVLKDAFDRIKVILNTNKHIHMFAAQAQQQNQMSTNQLIPDRNWVDQERERYRKAIQRVEHDLRELEKRVEELRQKVINGERKLRVSEVESLTETLDQVGRMAAQLKTGFHSLEDRLKHVMSSEMERVVKEEKFIKDEPSRMDSALRRCKKLASTMVTMKKLAMVQDTSVYHNRGENRVQTSVKPVDAGKDAEVKTANMTAAISSVECKRVTKPLEDVALNLVSLSDGSGGHRPATPRSASTESTCAGGVLDSLLEELQNVARSVSTNVGATGHDGGGSEKNGISTGNSTANGEKRVGFAEEVRVLSMSPDATDSDTIKRVHKTTAGYTEAPQTRNGGANGCGSENVSTVDTKREKENSKINGILDKSDGWKLHIGGMTHQRRSASPMLGNSTPFSTSEILNSFSANRSHSGTPCSFTSDPCAYPSHHDPPAPPPRSSSRTTLASRLGNSELDELTRQLSLGTCSSGVGEESRLLNSTDTGDWKDRICGQQDFENELEPVTPQGKPPPPPPPRNKQEMLEQRQHELLAKQLHQQNQFVTKF